MTTDHPGSTPILGQNITHQSATKFLALVAFAMKNTVILQAPKGPWHLSDNRQLQDCISVPDPSGEGELQIGKGIAKRPLRAMLAADPTNLAEIAEMMSIAAEVEVPDRLLQHLLNLGARWNRSMQLRVDEEWADDSAVPEKTTTADGDHHTEGTTSSVEPVQDDSEASGPSSPAPGQESPATGPTGGAHRQADSVEDTEPEDAASERDEATPEDHTTAPRRPQASAVDETAGW